MRKTLASLLLASTLLPLPAFAQEPIGVYVASRLGYGTLKDTVTLFQEDVNRKLPQSEGSTVVGLAGGYDFNRKFSLPVRVELEYAYLGDSSKTHQFIDRYGPYTVSSDNFKITLGGSTLFANGYFDFHNSSAFTPYVGMGLGASFMSVKAKGTVIITGPGMSATYSGSDKVTSNNFAWNLGVGVAWKATDRIAVDLGYRYANLGKVKDAGTDNIKSHQFLLGGRFSF